MGRVLPLLLGACVLVQPASSGAFGRKQGDVVPLDDSAPVAAAAAGVGRHFGVASALQAAGGAADMRLLRAHAEWQSAELGQQLPCTGARAVVYHGGAIGFGTDAHGMAHVFEAALADGRLFFVDWGLNPKSTLAFGDVIVNRHFPWDYATAVREGKVPDRKGGCTGRAAPGNAVLHVAHDTADGLLRQPGMMTTRQLSADVGRRMPPGGEHLCPWCVTYDGQNHDVDMLVRRFLLAPSKRVEAFYEAAAARLRGKFVIALVVRTGRGEQAKGKAIFLRARDEYRFIDCWRAAVEQIDPKLVAKRPAAVLLATDDVGVYDAFKKAARPGESVVFLQGSVVHTTSGQTWDGLATGAGGGSDDVDQGVLKAFADFFLLRFANVAFLTTRSKFGSTAVSLAEGLYRTYFLWSGQGGGESRKLPTANPFGHGCRVLGGHDFRWANKTAGDPFPGPPVVGPEECRVRAIDNKRLGQCAAAYLAHPTAVIMQSWGDMSEREQRTWKRRKCDDFAAKLNQARKVGSVSGGMADVTACTALPLRSPALPPQTASPVGAALQQTSAPATANGAVPSAGRSGVLLRAVCGGVGGPLKRCCEIYVGHPSIIIARTWGDLPVPVQHEWAHAQCDNSVRRVKAFRTVADFVNRSQALMEGTEAAARWCIALEQKMGKPRESKPEHTALGAAWVRLSCAAVSSRNKRAREVALKAYDASMRARVAALPQSPQEKRVISFGLYGTKERYIEGMIRNAQLAPVWFPGWSLRVYADDSVPAAVLARLRKLGVEIERCDVSGGIAGMFCRFFIADDATVDRYLIRDADSRLNGRDRLAVQEWIDSGKAIHALRDHPGHGSHHINGGMWGGVKGAIKDLRGQALSFGKMELKWADMDFLDKVIWPQVQNTTFAHDSYTCEKFPGSRPFPTQRSVDFEFVGQVWLTKFAPRQSFIDCCMRGKPAPLKCRKEPAWEYG
jgi:hypothetical protein